jgi:hypothetical protein
VTVGVGVPVAVAAKLTICPQEPVALLVLMFPGQAIVGAVLTVRLATVEVTESQEFVITTV